MKMNMKNYISYALAVVLFFLHQISTAQTKEIKSDADLPFSKYSTSGLEATDSISVAKWIKRTTVINLQKGVRKIPYRQFSRFLRVGNFCCYNTSKV